MMAILLIMTSNFVISDIVHLLSLAQRWRFRREKGMGAVSSDPLGGVPLIYMICFYDADDFQLISATLESRVFEDATALCPAWVRVRVRVATLTLTLLD